MALDVSHLCVEQARQRRVEGGLPNLPELQDLFVQRLLLAKLAGVLKLGNLSLDVTLISLK